MEAAGDRTPSARAAASLREIAALLALEKGNRFRSQAYERAAEVIASVPDLDAAAREQSLTLLPGVGSAIAGVVLELQRTGRSGLLERLRARFPPGAAELARVLSPARMRLVHDALGVSTLAELRQACEQGRVRELPGFGEKSERKLLARILAPTQGRRALILPRALAQGDALCGHLRAHPSVSAVELAGDLRRRVETIARLDVVVASDRPAEVAEHARRAPGLTSLERAEPERFVLRRAGALDAHVRVVPRADFPVALLQATGSAAHVARLGERARQKDLVLGERSLRAGRRRVPIASEEELYERLGMPFVPPELREDAGEVQAASAAELPLDLVQLADLQGAVHCHTDYSDGRHTIEEMARAAEALGLRYLTITDHSAAATFANGLDLERLRRQADELARVQERVGIRLLHGTEADILQDGSLDYPLAVLEGLDVVIASVHRRHQLSAQETTARLVRAMQAPIFKIWGHPLGRYVLSRPPLECDVDQVLDAAAHARVAIEVNGDPHRLDLPPAWIRAARLRGLRFVLSSDAHSTGGLKNARFGVDIARRGWLRKGEVLNTLGPEEFAAAVHP